MTSISKLYLILPVIGGGILASAGNFANRSLVEAVCYMILPIGYGYLLLREKLSTKTRIGFTVMMILGTIMAEVVVSIFIPRVPALIPITVYDWFAYRSSYLLFGIIQLFIFIPILIILSSKKVNAAVASIITGVLMVFYGMLGTFVMADHRPLLTSEQLPIILIMLLIVGCIYYLVLKLRMKMWYAIIQSVIILAIVILS